MPKKHTLSKDLSGQQFGKLTVIAPVRLVVRWKCICECGKSTYATTANLTNGNHRSCGCLVKERNTELSTAHGQSYEPIYGLWANMLNRCNNPNAAKYMNYGGRGINVCARWSTFENWHEDIGQYRPSKEYSLDRSDNDGGYWCGRCDECLANGWPMNCKWKTATDQARNKSNTVYLTFKDQTKTAYEWAAVTGLTVGVIISRHRHGWPTEKALTFPRGYHRNDNVIAFKDRALRVSEWAKITGIPPAVISYRLSAGWSVEESLTTPPLPRSKTRAGRKSIQTQNESTSV